MRGDSLIELRVGVAMLLVGFLAGGAVGTLLTLIARAAR